EEPGAGRQRGHGRGPGHLRRLGGGDARGGARRAAAQPGRAALRAGERRALPVPGRRGALPAAGRPARPALPRAARGDHLRRLPARLQRRAAAHGGVARRPHARHHPVLERRPGPVGRAGAADRAPDRRAGADLRGSRRGPDRARAPLGWAGVGARRRRAAAARGVPRRGLRGGRQASLRPPRGADRHRLHDGGGRAAAPPRRPDRGPAPGRGPARWARGSPRPHPRPAGRGARLLPDLVRPGAAAADPGGGLHQPQPADRARAGGGAPGGAGHARPAGRLRGQPDGYRPRELAARATGTANHYRWQPGIGAIL
ncbi:MAG: hypothetical protein AVDCRST_MAG18-907, partial [uncultured Thermomicrobiales bacterium]